MMTQSKQEALFGLDHVRSVQQVLTEPPSPFPVPRRRRRGVYQFPSYEVVIENQVLDELYELLNEDEI